MNSVLYRSRDGELSPLEWAQRYRCMQLLQKRANEILKYPLATVKVLSLLAIIRSLYLVVKMNGFMQLVNGNSALCFGIFLIVCFNALGQVFDLSEQVLVQQKRNGGNEWFRRFHRSCYPLKFEIAGMYFADPPMSLTMGSFVIENVANMLIVSK